MFLKKISFYTCCNHVKSCFFLTFAPGITTYFTPIVMSRLVSRFRLSYLRAEAHVELHVEFMHILETRGVTLLGLTAVHAPYSSLLAREKEILDFMHKSLLTPGILELDKTRDDIYRGLVKAIKASTHSTSAARKAAAGKLVAIIKYHGYVPRRRSFDKTAAIADLVDELTAREGNAALVNETGVAAWCADLLAANTAFNEAFIARNSEIGQRPATNMREIRPRVDAAFRDLLDAIEGLAKANGVDKYEEVIREWNALARYARNMIARGQGRGEAAGREQATGNARGLPAVVAPVEYLLD